MTVFPATHVIAKTTQYHVMYMYNAYNYVYWPRVVSQNWYITSQY